MPIDRPGGRDRPGERAEHPDRLVDQLRRAGDAEERQERSQGYDDTYFRDDRPVDGHRGNPSRERILWFRYDKARERADEAGDWPEDIDRSDDSDDPDAGACLSYGEFLEARRSVPDVERRAGHSVKTTGHVFGETGFLREDISGGDNPDGSPDGRVDEAVRMMRGDLQWRGLARNKTETHVETKNVVDAINGDLPKDIAIVVNNKLCGDLFSCRQFIDERLPRGHTVRVYDWDGTPHFFEGTYDEGTAG